MKKEVLIVFLIIALFSLSFVSAVEPAKSNFSQYDEKSFIFRTFREIEPKIRDYTQSYLPCPNRDPNKADIKAKIQELLNDTSRFNDAEITSMILECRQEGAEAFAVKLKEKTLSMEECINKIESGLFKNNITEYKEIDVIAECVIQEDFRERYSNKINDPTNQLFFENLFKKRILSVVNEIKLKEATHERTEEDDEELYKQKLEQERKENDPSTFDIHANYTLDRFPEYSGESTENFLQRFFNYFKRIFNLFEWQQIQQEKKNKRLSME